MNYGLKFSIHGEQAELNGYSDADWAGDVDTRRSTSGYVFQFGNGTISWSSRKEPTVAKSSTETEYVPLSSATQEAIWLCCLMKDFGKQTDAQPRSQVLSPTRRETLVGSGHVSPRIWEITNKLLGGGADKCEICLYEA